METNLCRCCLAQGLHRDLNTTYIWLDKKEIYADMLNECFSFILSASDQSSNGICNTCIDLLRSSLNFKRQVLKSEEEFLRRLQCEKSELDEKPIFVKVEPKISDDNDSSDLADTVNEIIVENIKYEPNEPTVKKKSEYKGKTKANTKTTAKRQRAVKAPADSTWRANKIRTMVSRLATSINSCDIPDITTLNKQEMKDIAETGSRKVTIKKEPTTKDSKIKLMWTSGRLQLDNKEKHKENLQTILKFSNATPFKNKTLLGFICGYCSATYPDPIDLRTHTETVHKEERLLFKSNFDMTDFTVKLNVIDLICKICDEKMDNLTVLKEHLVKAHKRIIHNDIKDHIIQFKLYKSDVYDCVMCSSTYETFKMLKQHMNKHYSNYACKNCDATFTNKRSLNAHNNVHIQGSVKCNYCDKIFTSTVRKNYHERTYHLGARRVSNCPHCNIPFKNYYQRNRHLVKVHNCEVKYKCNSCNKAYILKSLLMTHIKKTHLMERNHQCTECGARFFSAKAVRAHMIKHTGEKNFICDICNKAYARKYTLKQHMRIHNNDKRYKCSLCGTAFVQKCSLKSHLLSNHSISILSSDIVPS